MNRSISGVSSEKNDMERPNRASISPTIVELPLRCVWTSHPDREHSCESRIPARVVADAWRHELDFGRECAGFFHFAWRGHVWLAYGLPGGAIRGVYCPVHRAEREERLGYDPELVLTAAAGHAG
jgi:hypothetical protein